MCGISGFVDPDKSTSKDKLLDVISRMTDTISHRGPDDSGVWVDKSKGIALGHRRLSIMDVSQSGHQPMETRCGRYIIIFNGEIYNYRAI